MNFFIKKHKIELYSCLELILIITKHSQIMRLIITGYTHFNYIDMPESFSSKTNTMYSVSTRNPSPKKGENQTKYKSLP